MEELFTIAQVENAFRSLVFCLTPKAAMAPRMDVFCLTM
jgi:hypothetical protein